MGARPEEGRNYVTPFVLGVPRKRLNSAKHQRRLLKCSVLARLASVAVPKRCLGRLTTGNVMTSRAGA